MGLRDVPEFATLMLHYPITLTGSLLRLWQPLYARLIFLDQGFFQFRQNTEYPDLCDLPTEGGYAALSITDRAAISGRSLRLG